MAVATLAVVVEVGLWDARLRMPLTSGSGDIGHNLGVISSIAKHGWWWTDPSYGAPFGSQQYDFPTLFTDSVNLLLVKAMTIISSDPAWALNGYYLATFPLAALTGFLVLRSLRISPGAACVGAILFAVLPYHFLRGEGHAWLSGYWAVPLGVWLALGAAGHVEVWRPRPEAHGLRRLRTWSSARLVLVGLLIAGTGIYYALFTVILLLGAGLLTGLRERRPAVLLPAIAFGAIVVAWIVVLVSPSLIYQATHGANPATAVREPFEAELYGLKLVDLLFSRSGDRLPLLADFGKEYSQTTPLPSESGAPWLGALLAASFLFGIAFAVVRGAATRLSGRAAMVRDSGLLMAWVFVIATVGGLSTPFAYIVSAQVRAYNRISVMIAFLAAIVLCVVLDRIVRWLRARAPTERRGTVAAAITLIVVAAFGVWNQTGSSARPDYAAIATNWQNRSAVVSYLDHTLPRDAMILQLPYTPYPEHGPVHQMLDYDQLLPNVVSHRRDLRWTAGAMKGRSGDWMALTPKLTARELLTNAAAAGFAVVWLDRNGYEDGGAKIDAEIAEAVGSGPVHESVDRRFAVYPLGPYRDRLRSVATPAALEDASSTVLRRITQKWDGITSTRSGAPTWRLIGESQTAVDLSIDQPTAGRYVLRTTLTAPTPVAVTVTLPDGRRIETSATPDGTPLAATVGLDRDPRRIRFDAAPGAVPEGENAFFVDDFSLLSSETDRILARLKAAR